MANAGWDEEVSRHLIDGVQHGEIVNALILKDGHQSPPRAAVLLRVYRSCHHVSGESSIAWCVTSRWSGVTEM